MLVLATIQCLFIAIWIAICISADKVYFVTELSPQLPDWPKQRQISQKRALIPTPLIAQQCFALLPQVNFPANNLNFH